MSRYQAIRYDQPDFLDGVRGAVGTGMQLYGAHRQFKDDREKDALKAGLKEAGSAAPTEVAGRAQAQQALDTWRDQTAEIGPMTPEQAGAYTQGRAALAARPEAPTWEMGGQTQATPFSQQQIQAMRAARAADVYDQFGDPEKAASLRASGLQIDEGFHRQGVRNAQSTVLQEMRDTMGKVQGGLSNIMARRQAGELDDLGAKIEASKLTEGIPGVPTLSVDFKTGKLFYSYNGKLQQLPEGADLNYISQLAPTVLRDHYMERLAATDPAMYASRDQQLWTRGIETRKADTEDRKAATQESYTKGAIRNWETTPHGEFETPQGVYTIINGQKVRIGSPMPRNTGGGGGGDIANRLLGAVETVAPGPDGKPVRGTLVRYIGGGQEFLPGMTPQNLFKATQGTSLNNQIYGNVSPEAPANDRGFVRDAGLGQGVFNPADAGAQDVARILQGGGAPPPATSTSTTTRPPTGVAPQQAIAPAPSRYRGFSDMARLNYLEVQERQGTLNPQERAELQAARADQRPSWWTGQAR